MRTMNKKQKTFAFLEGYPGIQGFPEGVHGKCHGLAMRWHKSRARPCACETCASLTAQGDASIKLQFRYQVLLTLVPIGINHLWLARLVKSLDLIDVKAPTYGSKIFTQLPLCARTYNQA